MIEKLNLIEQSLLGINPAKFQSLSGDYLQRRFPQLRESTQEYGKKLGADKVKKGVPDIYYKLSNGKYVFVECNTEQGNVYVKLKRDLLKCFKIGIKNDDIESIFLFYTGRTISPKEDQELTYLVRERGITLKIIGIDTLKTALRLDFQVLAEQYLGIPIDSGQILDEISFLKTQSYNKLSTGFEQKFIGRETEIQEILTKLSTSDILLLCGSAGVGKTKIGLESCNIWCNQHPSFISKFISPKTGQLNTEIHAHFENNSDYIVLVDDAFRIEDIEKLIFFNQVREKKLKLILTVRDFAVKKLQRIFEQCNHLPVEEIQINRLKDEFINELLINIGVTSQLCQYKINRLVNGNPRLALMAAKQALEVNNCEVLNDVSDIYDLYFKPYLEDRNIEIKALKVLGILSAFKVIRADDIEIHSNIEKAFKIPKNQLWDNFIYLCENELVEFNDADRLDIAKITDQTLASYIFYQIFIQRKLLSFADLIQYFFANNKGRIRDALRPILDSYGFEKTKIILKPFVDEARKNLEHDLEDNKFDFFEEFYFCQEDEILIFLNEVLHKTESIPFNASDLKESNRWYFQEGYKYIELAKKLHRSSQHTAFAFQLVLKYLQKQPSNFKEVVKYLQQEVYFYADDYDEGYRIQVRLFEILLKEVSLKNEHEIIYKELLKEIAGKYLQIVANGIKPRSTLDNLQIHNIYIGNVDAWTEIRKKIWKYVIILIETDIASFNIIFKDALERGHYKTIESPILEEESKVVINLFDQHLNPNQLSHCLIAHKYLEFLSHCKISTKKYGAFFEKFTTITYRHHKILTYNYGSYSRRIRKNEKRIKHDEIQNLISDYLAKKTKNYNIEDYLKLLTSYAESVAVKKDAEPSWNLTIIFITLFQYSPDTFVKVIVGLFESGNKGKFGRTIIVEKLLHYFKGNEESLWNLIETYEFETKNHWQLDFLLLLPNELIKKYHYERLKKCISQIDSLFLSEANISKIKQYETLFKKRVFIEIFTQIQKRCSSNQLDFSSYDLIEKFTEEFANHVGLLKKLYIYFQQKRESSDYDGKDFQAILRMDSSFLTEYLSYCFPKKYSNQRIDASVKNWSFLWQSNDYESYISLIFDFFTQKEHIYHDNDSFLKLVFTPRGEKEKEVINFLRKRIEENPDKTNLLKIVFKIIVECFPEQTTSFFEFFVQNNASFETFRNLPIRPAMMVYRNDSRIYVLMNEVAFWEKIHKSLPLDLNYLEHRNFINVNIENTKREIEFEKRDSFWRDY